MNPKRGTLAVAMTLIVLVALAAGGTEAAVEMTPSASLTTAVLGWERWLRLDWTMQSRSTGQEISGYVHSHHGAPIYDVRLLAQSLDGAGNVLAQKLTWVHGILPGHQRTYFRIDAMPAAERYRVTVWAFSTIESNHR